MTNLSPKDHDIPLTKENNCHVEDTNILVTPANARNVGTGKPQKALTKRLITLSEAEDEEDDMRAELQYAEKRKHFYIELDHQ
jgi:hypothetical protein